MLYPAPFVIPKRSEESAFAGSIPAASNSRFLNGYRRFGMTNCIGQGDPAASLAFPKGQE